METLDKEELRSFEADLERVSGRLTVVVPKSLHAALRAEAVREGISLSELIRLKLGVPYRHMVQWVAGGTAEPKAA
jgi:predicted HicB family RNase H-like nuclease